MAKTVVNLEGVEGRQAGAAERGVLQSPILLQPRRRGTEMIPKTIPNRHSRQYGGQVGRGDSLAVIALAAADLVGVCLNFVRRTYGVCLGGTSRAGAGGLRAARIVTGAVHGGHDCRSGSGRREFFEEWTAGQGLTADCSGGDWPGR